MFGAVTFNQYVNMAQTGEGGWELKTPLRTVNESPVRSSWSTLWSITGVNIIYLLPLFDRLAASVFIFL